MCLQPDKRQRRVWSQSGQAERLRHTVQQVQQDGGSLIFLGWHYVWPTYATGGMEGAETAIRYRNDILQPIGLLVCAATWHTNSKSLTVLLYNLQFLVLMSNTGS